MAITSSEPPCLSTCDQQSPIIPRQKGPRLWNQRPSASLGPRGVTLSWDASEVFRSGLEGSQNPHRNSADPYSTAIIRESHVEKQPDGGEEAGHARPPAAPTAVLDDLH